MADFKKIAFGFSSAEAERSNDPGLLLEGHIDYKAASEEALSGRKFLFLGYKGAGKSSIAERIQLSLSNSYSDFVTLVSLGDFPFTPFSKIIRGDVEPEAKLPTAWSWILLPYLLESFDKDTALKHHDLSAFHDAVSAFRQMGLSPAGQPGAIVRTSAKHNFKLSLPGKLAEYGWSGSETRPASEIPYLVESLRTLICGVRTDNRHYLIIDGLDDVLTSREVQFKSLSALTFEVSRLNKSFDDNGVSAKIILLCRTDVFERIPGANKNKVRQDLSVELDWYHDPREPDNSLLVQIAQLRAKRSLGHNIDIFNVYFPEYIGSTETPRFLLDMTRHTPRDFLRLLIHIQQFSTPSKLSDGQIKSGMRDYSIKYFLPEIQDEMSGYATPEEIRCLLDALGKLRKRDFKLGELIEVARNARNPLAADRVYEMVATLFNCSALGNIQYKANGNTYYTFKYRNRHSTFNESEGIMLHRGLWKALNLV
jgi:hypothetical protein